LDPNSERELTVAQGSSIAVGACGGWESDQQRRRDLGQKEGYQSTNEKIIRKR